MSKSCKIVKMPLAWELAKEIEEQKSTAWQLENSRLEHEKELAKEIERKELAKEVDFVQLDLSDLKKKEIVGKSVTPGTYESIRFLMERCTVEELSKIGNDCERIVEDHTPNSTGSTVKSDKIIQLLEELNKSLNGDELDRVDKALSTIQNSINMSETTYSIRFSQQKVERYNILMNEAVIKATKAADGCAVMENIHMESRKAIIAYLKTQGIAASNGAYSTTIRICITPDLDVLTKLLKLDLI